MKLDKGLQEFLKEAIEEKSICTVEGSFRRQLTLEEEKHLNATLHPLGHTVHCFKCDACFRNSGGKQPYHIERIPLKEEGGKRMIKGLEITNGSIYADDNSDFGYEEFIALLENNGLSFGGGTRTILEDEDGNLFDENMKQIEI